MFAMLEINKFEKKGALQILLLLEEGGKPITTLREDINAGQSRTYASLKVLKDHGLIIEEKEEVFPYSSIQKLTDKGQTAASMINDFVNLIQ